MYKGEAPNTATHSTPKAYITRLDSLKTALRRMKKRRDVDGRDMMKNTPRQYNSAWQPDTDATEQELSMSGTDKEN